MRFADFVIDSSTRQLLRHGEPIHLSPKAFHLLLILLQSAPRAIGKRELLDQIWPGTFVSDASLGNLVTELRRVLAGGASEAGARWIRTVHGFGYAFDGQLHADGTEDFAYRLVWGAREIALNQGVNILGRDESAVAWIDASTVSRRHAQITIDDRRAVLEDLGSKNGTFMRGKRISAPCPLADGDEIGIGRVRMSFRIFRAAHSTETDLRS